MNLDEAYAKATTHVYVPPKVLNNAFRWIMDDESVLPCRREYMDTVEVEVAEGQGGLVKFGTGRTLVTFVFKRDV